MYLRTLSNVKLTVTSGMVEVNEYIEEMSIEDALKAANDFNIGKLHSDVYVVIQYNGKNVIQIVTDNKIVAFAEQD